MNVSCRFFPFYLCFFHMVWGFAATIFANRYIHFSRGSSINCHLYSWEWDWVNLLHRWWLAFGLTKYMDRNKHLLPESQTKWWWKGGGGRAPQGRQTSRMIKLWNLLTDKSGLAIELFRQDSFHNYQFFLSSHPLSFNQSANRCLHVLIEFNVERLPILKAWSPFAYKCTSTGTFAFRYFCNNSRIGGEQQTSSLAASRNAGGAFGETESGIPKGPG